MGWWADLRKRAPGARISKRVHIGNRQSAARSDDTYNCSQKIRRPDITSIFGRWKVGWLKRWQKKRLLKIGKEQKALTLFVCVKTKCWQDRNPQRYVVMTKQ